jgi:hypothetical protein
MAAIANVMATLPPRAARNAPKARPSFFQTVVMAVHRKTVDFACIHKWRD